MANEPNYSSNPSKDEPKKKKVRVIPLEYIDEFPGHPFKVLDDESMQKLMNSIEEIGVQSPIVARIKEDQRYDQVFRPSQPASPARNSVAAVRLN